MVEEEVKINFVLSVCNDIEGNPQVELSFLKSKLGMSLLVTSSEDPQ